MTIPRSFAWAALALLASARLASAGDAPLDLKSAPTPPPRPATLASPATDAPKPELTAAEAIAKANAYLDGARVMSADFVQIGPDGQRSEGQLYVARPGRLLFRFAPPARLEIVAALSSIATRRTLVSLAMSIWSASRNFSGVWAMK